MGNKIHVAEVYQVKHHIFDNFNGKSDVINRMLAENCPGLSWEGEDVECSERLEVPRAELGDLIAKNSLRQGGFREMGKALRHQRKCRRVYCHHRQMDCVQRPAE